MTYFTSDLHLGHANIIKLCNRPFSSVEEMDETLTANWNARVKDSDNVYILGDLMYRNTIPPNDYLKRLKGKKHLIVGNHDSSWMKNADMDKYFVSVDDMLYIATGKEQCVLCHYPMMSWPHYHKSFMVFGHIHNNTDQAFWKLIEQSDVMFNAGVDVNYFFPVTFDEMVKNNEEFKRKVALGDSI